MHCKINTFELFSYYCIWVSAIVITIYTYLHAQNEIFEDHPHLRYTLRDFSPGWAYLSRDKDVSDVEWSSWKFFIQTSWFYMAFQFFISEIIRRIYFSSLKYWYIVSSIIFVALYMGLRQLVVILIQPILFCILIFCGGQKISIWVTSIILLMSYNSLKYKYFFWKILDDGNLQDEKVYLLLFAVAWIELRCISYSIDYVERQKKIQNVQEKSGKFINDHTTAFQNIVNMFSYVLYLPLLYIGPIMLYEEFENSFNFKNEKLWPRLKSYIVDMIIFLIYTFLLDFAFHYIYFCAMQSDIKSVAKLSSFALLGGGLWMAFEFHVKYVISYGTTTAFARLDNMQPPPTPRCIARIHIYSHMWRYFDVGLYKFLVRYIYKPSYAMLRKNIVLPKMMYKIIASFCTFTFIFMWHGTVWNIFVWSVLNYCGIILEYSAKAFSETDWYKSFKSNVLKTESMEVRFIACLCSPLLVVSVISNFYLFGGQEVGDMFYGLLVWPAPHCVLIILISVYCCSHVSISLEDVPSRTDVETHRIKAE